MVDTFVNQREKNQLERLRDLVLAQPQLVLPDITPAMIEALLQRDGWDMSIMVPTSAWNGNNVTLPVLRGTYAPATSIWRAKLEAQRAHIERAIPCVGRLERTEGNIERVEGTGWRVRDDVVVTNRHVAKGLLESIEKQTARLRIDFLEEDGSNGDPGEDEPERGSEFRVLDVPYMAPEPEIDLAFVRIEPRTGAERAVIALGDDPRVGMDVCAIGYPAVRDTVYDAVYHRDYFFDIFGSLLGVKRVSPGTVTTIDGGRVSHDCSTAGGSSGSVVLDLATGKAIALNYGEGGRVNHAVPVSIVRQRLAGIP